MRLDTDPTGKALKFFGSIQDVTDLRQQASRFSESERWLTMVQEHGLVGFWDWDMLTDRSSWSEQMEVLYGLQPGEGGIHVWESMVHPDDLQAAHAAARKVVQAGRRQLIEDYRIIRRDGRLGWILNYGLFSYDSSGKPVRMQGVSVDITQRKEAELALLLVEESQRALIEAIPETILLMSADGLGILANATALARMGVTQEQFIGQYIFDLFPAEVAARRKAYLEQVIKTGEMVTFADPRDGLELAHHD